MRPTTVPLRARATGPRTIRRCARLSGCAVMLPAADNSARAIFPCGCPAATRTAVSRRVHRPIPVRRRAATAVAQRLARWPLSSSASGGDAGGKQPPICRPRPSSRTTVSSQGLPSRPSVCTVATRGRQHNVRTRPMLKEAAVPTRAHHEEASERAQRDARLSLRTSTHQQQLIRRAAAALDKSVTNFVLDSVSAAAEQVLADRRWFMLTDEQWAQFQQLLDAPVEEFPRLQHTLTTPTVFDDEVASED